MPRTSNTKDKRAIFPKPDVGWFGIYFGAGLTVLFFALQANGVVELNWLLSTVIYFFVTIVIVWSFSRHAVPHRSRLYRAITGTVLILSLGSLGVYGTFKQYQREHDAVKESDKRTLPATSPSIHDWFAQDFDVFSFDGEISIGVDTSFGRKTVEHLEYKVWMDNHSHSKFLSIYIPKSQYVFEAAKAVPDRYTDILSANYRRATYPPSPLNGERYIEEPLPAGVYKILREKGVFFWFIWGQLNFEGPFYFY